MKVTAKLTSELDDDLWGFSHLIGDRNVSDNMHEIKKEILDLMEEDILSIIENGNWDIEIKE